MIREGDASRLKRLAEQITVQLPGDKLEALAVLAFVRALIEWENSTEATILPFVRLVAPEI